MTSVSFEIAASRLTKSECVALVSEHSLHSPGLDLPTFAAGVSDTIRLRGFIEQLWYNSGDYDPDITAGTEFDFAYGFTKGATYLAGANAKPWEVWAWLKSQYDADPVGFLTAIYGTDRAHVLVAPLAPATVPSTTPNKYYAHCSKTPRGSTYSDRITYPYAKIVTGNPSAAMVSSSGGPNTTTEVRLTTSRSNCVYQFAGRMISFGPTKNTNRGHITSGATSTADTVFSGTGFGIFEAGDKVLITGCNRTIYNRVGTVITQSNGDTLLVDIDGGGDAELVTAGSVQFVDRQQSGYCTSAIQVDQYEVQCTFDPPLTYVPKIYQYAATLSNTISEDEYPFDKTLDGLVDILQAAPDGHRHLLISIPLSISDEANIPMWYCDGAGGGSVISYDLHWETREPWLRWYFEYIQEKLASDNTNLDYMFFDWEGIPQWYYLYSGKSGSVEQLIEEDAAGDYATQFGFPTADCRSVVVTTPVAGVPITEQEMKYHLINNRINRDAWSYYDKVAGLAKEVFGDQLVVQGYRAGSLGMSYTTPSAMQTQTSPLSTHHMTNARPDALGAWISSGKNVLADYKQSPPMWVEHPYRGNANADAQGYGMIESAVQFHQAGCRLSAVLPWSLLYGFQDPEYMLIVANTPWVYDSATHAWMASDVDAVNYYNAGSTDDKAMDDLLKEWEKVFPTGNRIPVVLENPGDGGPWENAYVRSCNDNNGRLVYYFSLNPLVATTITQVGDDVVITCPAGYEAQSMTIPHATITVPDDRVTSGVWVTQVEFVPTPGTESWLQYVRRVVAEAIEAHRESGGFIFNDFQVIETYYPAQQIEDVAEQPVCYVIGLGADQDQLGRGKVYRSQQPIQIAFQAVLSSPGDVSAADTYAKLIEQLKYVTSTCMISDPSSVSWQSNDVLRDETGSVVAYEGMREASTFEHYFTANYLFATTQGCDPPGR